MDWLGARQDAIEARLARRHLAPEANPSKMALFDLSSSWLEGTHCPLAARGYSRDGKKARLQIEYGLLTDPEGLPVAVRVLPGNTGDPAAFTGIIKVVRDTQPGPVRRHPCRCPGTRRAHQRTAAGLRPHRRPDPARADVARTTIRAPRRNRRSAP